jgi:hypothetical protein
MTTALRWVLILLLLVAVFDPADRITHLKVPLFVLAWLIFLVDTAVAAKPAAVPYGLLLYTTVFVFVLPLGSIAYYFLSGGALEPYEGFPTFKSYLFLTLAVLLTIKRIDLVRPLSFILTLLSCVLLVTYASILMVPFLYLYLLALGSDYGFLAVGGRTYGDTSYLVVYYVTSPLIVIAETYFAHRAVTSVGRTRYLNIVLLAINVLGILKGGTRNNLVIGLVAPLAVIFWYSRRKILIASLYAAALVVALAVNYQFISGMLDPTEVSNAVKLSHLRDYLDLFGNVPTLLLGQGLGSYFNTTARGSLSLTELTYMEFVRNYGLVVASVFFGLLLYPLWSLSKLRYRESHYIFLAYFGYLVMCITNPLLVSSSGMLILAVVLYKVFVPSPLHASPADLSRE